MDILPDHDPQETLEWLDALEAVMEREGVDRAHFLLGRLIDKARRNGAYLPYSANTAYLNTIPPSREERSPGNNELEQRIRSYVRWNAAMIVLRAGKKDLELGGHIASYASAVTLGLMAAWFGGSREGGEDVAIWLSRLAQALAEKSRQDGDTSQRSGAA